MNAHEAVTGVVLTMNRPSEFEEAIRQLVPQLRGNDQLLVIDQCAAQCECLERVASLGSTLGARYRSIRRSDLSGLPAARNMALDLASTPLVFFMDDDAEPMPGCLDALREALVDEAAVGVGAIQSNKGHRPGWAFYYRIFRRDVFRDKRQEADYTPGGPDAVIPDTALPGAGFMVRLDAARKVRFNERLVSYAYGEDSEFALRLRQVGRTCLIRNAMINHKKATGNRTRTDYVEMRDVVPFLRFTRDALGRPTFSTRCAYVWANLGVTLEVAVRVARHRSTAPIKGWFAGWKAASHNYAKTAFVSD